MGPVTLGSKLVLVGRVFYVTYLWCLKACIVGVNCEGQKLGDPNDADS